MEEHKGIEGLLKALEGHGCCRLAPSIPYIIPLHKDTWVPFIESWQSRYIKRLDSETAKIVNGPAFASNSVPENLAGGVKGWQLELAAELLILQAPAAFTVPVVVGRPLNTSFKVKFSMASGLPLNASISVGISVLEASQVGALSSWMPQPATGFLNAAEAHANITLKPSGIEGTGGSSVYSAAQEFSFPNLTFKRNSNGQPLWLVFYATLPCRGSILFTHFKLPTMVVDSDTGPAADFAMKTLWQGITPGPSSTPPLWEFPHFCAYARQELDDELSLTRRLGDDDALALAARAGVFPDVDTSGKRVREGSSRNVTVESMDMYISKSKYLLQLVRHHYNRSSPQIMAGFSMDRDRAERLLAGELPGTFFFRFGRAAGTLVLSMVGRDGGVTHVGYSFKTLSMVNLEEIVSMNSQALILFDPSDGMRYPREFVLNKEYHNDPAVEALVLQRTLNRHTAMSSGSTGISGSGSGAPGVNGGAGAGAVHAAEGDQLPFQGAVYGLAAEQEACSRKFGAAEMMEGGASWVDMIQMLVPHSIDKECEGKPAVSAAVAARQ